jgi:hypothetical protein
VRALGVSRGEPVGGELALNGAVQVQRGRRGLALRDDAQQQLVPRGFGRGQQREARAVDDEELRAARVLSAGRG